MTILHYRNLDSIAKWMNHTDPISKFQHLSFVEKLKTSCSQLYFGVYHHNRYVGSIYIVEESSDTWERGIYIIPEFQGSGISYMIEKTFFEKARLAGIRTLNAEIKKNNIQSIKYHEKMGYKKINENVLSVKYRIIL